VYDYTTNAVPGDDERTQHYWRDVGTLDAYFDANLDLVQPEPIFNLYNTQWPLYSHHRTGPPAKFVADWRSGDPSIVNSIVCMIVSGARVASSILSVGSHVLNGADLENAVILDDVVVGANSVLRNCVIDKNVVIPDGAKIGVDMAHDIERFTVSSGGIVVIAKNSIIE